MIAIKPYLCPVCKRNWCEFEIIYKIAQEVRKDRHSGRTVYKSDEYVSLTRGDGRPDLDVRCRKCGYVGTENAFVGAAAREAR